MALVTTRKRTPLLQRLANSIPVLGPIMGAIASSRKSRRNKVRSTALAVVPSISTSQVSRLKKLTRQHRRKKLGGPTRGSRAMSRADGGITSNPVPVSLGMGVTGSTFSLNGPANKLADYDNDKSLKIRGFGTLNAVPNGVSTTTSGNQGLFATSGTTFIGAQDLDIRLASFAQVFTYYAIRKAKFTYLPSINPGGSGAVGNAAGQILAFGIDEDVDYGYAPYSYNASNFPQVLDMSPSMATQSCTPQSMTYTHSGTRTWFNSATGESDNSDKYQFAIIAVSNTVSTAASQIYGSLFVEYEIDFYSPSYLRASIDAKPPKEELDDNKDKKDQKSDFVFIGAESGKAVGTTSLTSVQEPVSPTPSELVDLKLLRAKRERHFGLSESKSDSKLPLK